jgi:hypothetical protein
MKANDKPKLERLFGARLLGGLKRLAQTVIRKENRHDAAVMCSPIREPYNNQPATLP